MNPTADRVRALFDYDPATGIFTWRWRPQYDFKNVGVWKSWNDRYAGARAGHVITDGYRMLHFDGRAVAEHRAAWLYCHGKLPDQVDHKNGKTDENCIDNLRDCTSAENSRNQAIRMTNKSGVIGVCWDKYEKKWKAYINADGRQKTLGSFGSVEEAAAVRKSAEVEYGYYPNHGRAA